MSFLRFLKNILQLLLSPKNAWEDIEREQTPVNVAIERGLYPLMAIMLITVFIRPTYGLEHFELTTLLQKALIQFVALFIALYGGRTIMEHFLTHYNYTGENDPIAVGNVAAYGTGLMTVFQIVENLIPVQLTVTLFLPAFAAVCIWKADRYLDIERRAEIKYMLICILSLTAPVILINLLMSYIIS